MDSNTINKIKKRIQIEKEITLQKFLELISSGSIITKEVAADTLTIARSRQVKVENWKGPKSR